MRGHELTITSIDGEFYKLGPMPGQALAEELVRQIAQDKETLDKAIADKARKEKQ